MNAELKNHRKQYVTVEEACRLCNRSERTIRRWIDKEYVRVIRDEQTRSVRIDLDDIERMQAMKPDTIHPVRDEIERLTSNEESQEQRIEKLEQQVEMLLQRVDFLMAKLPDGQSNLVVFPHSRVSRQGGAESRGLPSGTQRLVPFAEQHKVVVSQIKNLFLEHEIDLIRYQREGDPVRNKQEWWISPEQQEQLVRYWQEHHMDYTPCGQCQGCVGKMQNNEID